MEDEEARSIAIRPLVDWRENEDGSLRVEASGPYTSAGAYLRSHLVLGNKSSWDRTEAKLMDTLLCLAPDLDSQDGFVLCPPDFDSQNVLVDDQVNVTGIIDWDMAHTMPRPLGYARYPG